MRATLFVVIYHAKLEKLPEVVKMVADFKPISGVETKAEYATANGNFIEIVEVSDAQVLTKYIATVGLKGGINEKIDIYPVTRFEEWLGIQKGGVIK